MKKFKMATLEPEQLQTMSPMAIRDWLFRGGFKFDGNPGTTFYIPVKIDVAGATTMEILPRGGITFQQEIVES